MKKVKCDNCNGRGYIHNFNHVANGLCFKCNGKGIVDSCLTKAFVFPIPTKEQATQAFNGSEYHWDLFQQKFNINPRDALSNLYKD